MCHSAGPTAGYTDNLTHTHWTADYTKSRMSATPVPALHHPITMIGKMHDRHTRVACYPRSQPSPHTLAPFVNKGSPARAPTAVTADDRPLRQESMYPRPMGSPARAPIAATADDRPLRQKSTSCSMGSPGLAPTAAHANGRPQPHPHTCGSPTGSPSSAAPTRAAPSTCTLPRTRCACHLGSRCERRRERAGTSWRMQTSRPRPQQAPAFAERRPAKKGSMPRSTRTASRKGTVGAPARERCDQRRCESRAAARVQAHSARQVRFARLRESGSRPHVALSSSVAPLPPPLLEKATRPSSALVVPPGSARRCRRVVLRGAARKVRGA